MIDYEVALLGRTKLTSDEHVLAVARDLFTKEGYAVSTRRVAAAAGLSQATLVQRFGSKEQMFAAAMLPPPLEVASLVARGNEGTLSDLAISLTREIAARLPIVLQLATAAGQGSELVESAHARLGVPQVATALGAWIADKQEQGAIPSHAPAGAIVEALFVAAHGFTLMMLSSGTLELPVAAIRRFADILAGTNKGV